MVAEPDLDPILTPHRERHDGFHEVPSRAAARRPSISRVEVCQAAIPFEALLGLDSMNVEVKKSPEWATPNR